MDDQRSILADTEFFSSLPCPDGLLGPPSLLQCIPGTLSLGRGRRAWTMRLATHLLLVLKFYLPQNATFISASHKILIKTLFSGKICIEF
jgi:hypothetical protein